MFSKNVGQAAEEASSDSWTSWVHCVPSCKAYVRKMEKKSVGGGGCTEFDISQGAKERNHLPAHSTGAATSFPISRHGREKKTHAHASVAPHHLLDNTRQQSKWGLKKKLWQGESASQSQISGCSALYNADQTQKSPTQRFNVQRWCAATQLTSNSQLVDFPLGDDGVLGEVGSQQGAEAAHRRAARRAHDTGRHRCAGGGDGAPAVTGLSGFGSDGAPVEASYFWELSVNDFYA